jgi:anti-sigma B factor antagonist
LEAETPSVAIRMADGRHALVELSGDLDVATASLVEETLTMLIAEGRDQITVDVAHLAFCDCAGLGIFVAVDETARATAGQLRLTRSPPQLARLLALAGLDTVLTDPDALPDHHPEAVR